VESSHWFLESIAADGSHLNYDIDDLPFRIGRGQENNLVLATPGLSRKHAMLYDDISAQLRLTDLNSTNGTFVNRTAHRWLVPAAGKRHHSFLYGRVSSRPASA
jgi:pSer/pThr/pTyr-binding forkhead associated (FHA) protein